MKVSISKENTKLLMSGSKEIDTLNRLQLNLDDKATPDADGLLQMTPSQLVNKVLQRYYVTIQQSIPLWPEELWSWVLQAYNGYTQMPIGDIFRIKGAVADDMGVEHEDYVALVERAKHITVDLTGELNPLYFDGKANDDFAALMGLLAETNPGECLAVAEVIERLWGRHGNVDLREILSELSGRYRNEVYLSDKPHWSIVRVDDASVAGAPAKQVQLVLDEEKEITGLIQVQEFRRDDGTEHQWKLLSIELPVHARPFRQRLARQAIDAFGRLLNNQSLDQLCPTPE